MNDTVSRMTSFLRDFLHVPDRLSQRPEYRVKENDEAADDNNEPNCVIPEIGGDDSEDNEIEDFSPMIRSSQVNLADTRVTGLVDGSEIMGVLHTREAQRDITIYNQYRSKVSKNYYRKLDHEVKLVDSKRLLSIKYYDLLRNELTLEQFLACAEDPIKNRLNEQTYQGFIVEGVYPYQIDTTDKQHLLSSVLERLVGTLLEPDQDVLRPLLQEVDALYADLFNTEDKTLPDVSFNQYLSSRENFSKNKKQKYREAFNNSYKDPKKWNMTYNAFLKAGEELISDRAQSFCGSKGRLVLSAPPESVGLAPYVSYLISKWIFPKIPQIMVGKNAKDICQILDDLYDPTKVFLSLDNHRHDAHQDSDIHNHNVHTVFMNLDKEIKEHLGLDNINMYNLSKYFDSQNHTIAVRYQKRANRMRLRVRGTTISGNAALTTLGNSLNVWSVLTIIIKRFLNSKGRDYKARTLNKQNDINLMLAGDDSIIQIPKAWVGDFTAYLALYFHPEKDEVVQHGVGWCCKEAQVHTSDDVKFLSKIFFMGD